MGSGAGPAAEGHNRLILHPACTTLSTGGQQDHPVSDRHTPKRMGGSMHEVDLNDDYDQILKFTMNILGLNPQNHAIESQIHAEYFAAATSVFVANRSDKALARLEATVTDAEGRLRDTLQQATQMMLAASDIATRQASQHARKLTIATWVLGGATLILSLGTFALVYYTRLLAFHP